MSACSFFVGRWGHISRVSRTCSRVAAAVVVCGYFITLLYELRTIVDSSSSSSSLPLERDPCRKKQGCIYALEKRDPTKNTNVATRATTKTSYASNSDIQIYCCRRFSKGNE